MEIEGIKLTDMKNCTKEIFNQYDIYTYVENLSHVLNEENIHFFLSYNLKNYKLLAVFIFCIINENFKFLKNIFKLIVFNSCNKSEKSFKENLTFISYFNDAFGLTQVGKILFYYHQLRIYVFTQRSVFI
jgi:hypothetical protein